VFSVVFGLSLSFGLKTQTVRFKIDALEVRSVEKNGMRWNVR